MTRDRVSTVSFAAHRRDLRPLARGVESRSGRRQTPVSRLLTGSWAPKAVIGLLLAVTTTLSLAVSAASASNRASDLVAVVNVRDHLDRGLAGSLGHAQVGGPYTVGGHVRTHVSGGQAVVGPLQPGHAVRVLLSRIHTTDQRLQATVHLPKKLGRGGEWVGVKIRAQRGGSYRVLAHVDAAGRIGIRIARVGGHRAALAARGFV